MQQVNNSRAKLLKLNRYLELVRLNAKGTSGELREFWMREIKKTETRIAKV